VDLIEAGAGGAPEGEDREPAQPSSVAPSHGLRVSRVSGNTGAVQALVAAGAAFLLAVLWFDLMFDVQAAGHRGQVLAEPELASIAGYYRRVTTLARPMNRLVMLAMAGTLASIGVELARGTVVAWARWPAPFLAVPPMALAGARTVGNAVRLGARIDDAAGQSRLARSILRDHVACAVAIAALLGLQLAAAF
jgi:hypothetical protein